MATGLGVIYWQQLKSMEGAVIESKRSADAAIDAAVAAKEGSQAALAQAQAAAEANQLTKDQLSLTRASNDLSLNVVKMTYRSRLSLETVWTPLVEVRNKKPQVQWDVSYTNVGRGVATQIQLHTEVMLVETLPRTISLPQRADRGGPYEVRLEPGGTQKQTATYFLDRVRDDFAQYQRGNRFLIINMLLTYNDEFGDDHSSTWCGTFRRGDRVKSILWGNCPPFADQVQAPD